MTPQASKLYFELLETQLNKQASWWGGGANKLLAELTERAGRLGMSLPEKTLHLGELKNFQKVLYEAEGAAAQARTIAKLKAVNKAHAPAEEAVAAVTGRRPGLGLMLGAAGAGGVAGGALGYGLGGSSRDDEISRQRLLGYGGGIATGLAAPSILKGINNIVSNQGLLPNMGSFESEFTDI